MLDILDFIYSESNLLFYIILSIIFLCFIIILIISIKRDNRKEEEIEIPKIKDNLDSDTFVKRLEELKKGNKV